MSLIKWSGISFHSWNLLLYNRLTHEHWRLAIFEFMSTFLRPPSSKELHKVSCLILGVKLFQMKAFCFLCISSINCFENEVINVKNTILDSANVLKIIIFPSSVTVWNRSCKFFLTGAAEIVNAQDSSIKGIVFD